jgi:hypothetical protein
MGPTIIFSSQSAHDILNSKNNGLLSIVYLRHGVKPGEESSCGLASGSLRLSARWLTSRVPGGERNKG